MEKNEPDPLAVIIDTIELEGLRAGLRTLVRAGYPAIDAVCELVEEIIRARGKDCTLLLQATYAWLNQEAEDIEEEHKAWVARMAEIAAEEAQALKDLDDGGAQAA